MAESLVDQLTPALQKKLAEGPEDVRRKVDVRVSILEDQIKQFAATRVEELNSYVEHELERHVTEIKRQERIRQDAMDALKRPPLKSIVKRRPSTSEKRVSFSQSPPQIETFDDSSSSDSDGLLSSNDSSDIDSPPPDGKTRAPGHERSHSPEESSSTSSEPSVPVSNNAIVVYHHQEGMPEMKAGRDFKLSMRKLPVNAETQEKQPQEKQPKDSKEPQGKEPQGKESQGKELPHGKDQTKDQSSSSQKSSDKSNRDSDCADGKFELPTKRLPTPSDPNPVDPADVSHFDRNLNHDSKSVISHHSKFSLETEDQGDKLPGEHEHEREERERRRERRKDELQRTPKRESKYTSALDSSSPKGPPRSNSQLFTFEDLIEQNHQDHRHDDNDSHSDPSVGSPPSSISRGSTLGEHGHNEFDSEERDHLHDLRQSATLHAPFVGSAPINISPAQIAARRGLDGDGGPRTSRPTDKLMARDRELEVESPSDVEDIANQEDHDIDPAHMSFSQRMLWEDRRR